MLTIPGDPAEDLDPASAAANAVSNVTPLPREPLRFVRMDTVMDQLMADLEADRQSPLVTVVPKGDAFEVTFFDRGLPHFRYEFTCNGTGDALHWIAHLAEKGWVTTRHIEIFARAVMAGVSRSGTKGGAR